MRISDEQYTDIIANAGNYTFLEKVKGFIHHIYMYAFAPHNYKRFRYMEAVKQFEERYDREQRERRRSQ
jgi:hypothetical protein